MKKNRPISAPGPHIFNLQLLRGLSWAALPLLVLAGVMVLSASPPPEELAASEISVPAPQPAAIPAVATAVVEPPEPEPVHTYAIQPGDTLGSIFDQFEISHQTMYHILEADESLLALDTLRPGNRLTFRLTEKEEQLHEMELFIHAGNKVVYRRSDESSFEYEELISEGDWEQQVLVGEINGSFYLSAKRAGLSEREIVQVAELFADQLNFARQIQAGDRFQIVRSRQSVVGEPTGQSRIDGVRILRRNQNHSAFLGDDGNYYDQNGDSLMRAFMRYPTSQRYRISSHFNPNRRHPITGRVSPHNGVDFATPTGTPVLAVADGVVTRVLTHPFAGKYIEIEHGGKYVTRYLHLHRFLVRKGESLARGQRIALSGNTGRSTGPHLHFELHVRGRPVNPLTADIPRAASLPEEERERFNHKVTEMVALMEQSERQLARLDLQP